jgi:hypothetical protein
VVVVVVDVLVEATAVDLPEVPPQLLASRHPARVASVLAWLILKGRDQFKRNHRSERADRMAAVRKPSDRQDHNLIRPLVSSQLPELGGR